MILMNNMKVSVIGSSNDVKFFLHRAFHLNKKDIIFSVFDSRESQENIRKQFKFIETPWGIEDILLASDLIINAMPLRRSNEFYEIIKNNNVNLYDDDDCGMERGFALFIPSGKEKGDK